MRQYYITVNEIDPNLECLVDMFSGGGGTTTGTLNAVQKLYRSSWDKYFNAIAINHWTLALKTHSANHKKVHHIDSDLERVYPQQVLRGGKIRLLTGSPECTHFSKAYGGKPVEKQSRASAKYFLRWLKQADVEDFWLENVPEFEDWGPTHRTCSCGSGTDVPAKKHDKSCEFEKPIKSRKGQYFLHFIKKIRELGYNVEYRNLNTANYGIPQTRIRLIMIGRKGKQIVWPEPTHVKIEHKQQDMFRKTQRNWKTAKSFLNLKDVGKSISEKKLSQNTLKRIWDGFLRHGGKAFLLGQQSGSVARTLDGQLPTISGAGAIHLVHPFIIQMEHGGSTKGIHATFPTITSADAFALVTPYIIEYYGTGKHQSIDRPLKTITSNDHFALITPMIIKVGKQKYKLDFYHRMLTPKELAMGQTFPKNYIFVGKRKEIVKQIGNAVPPEFAEKISYSLLST